MRSFDKFGKVDVSCQILSIIEAILKQKVNEYKNQENYINIVSPVDITEQNVFQNFKHQEDT